MKRKVRIIFMGTPEFAVPVLEELLSDDMMSIVGVITSPDRLGGRGLKQRIVSPVKKYSLEQNLPIYQPEKLRNKEFLAEYRNLKPDLAVVVAFRMLPEVIWSIPPMGTINLHASLLPAYRGAAPINWAIIKGEKETGLTTFVISKEIDTGSIIFQEKVAINNMDTAGTLHDQMKVIGAKLVHKTVHALISGQAPRHDQDESRVSYAPKIFHKDCQLHGSFHTEDAYNFVRGLSPYPTAWTCLDGMELKIFTVLPVLVQHTVDPGTFLLDENGRLRLYLSDGYIELLEVQLEGKKRMSISEFLRGYPVERSKDIIIE